MRYIDIDELWDERVKAFAKKADGILAELRKLRPEERGKYISEHANWSVLKQKLAELSYDKCWYSECRSLGGDRDVDHYRPKGKIHRYMDWPESGVEPAHDGYWWLAFNWKNYRYSCRFCNAPRRSPDTDIIGGKWDYFPVRDEGARVRHECDIEDLEDEQALILDPTHADDVDLLLFDEFGRALPRSTAGDSWEYKRTQLSIKLLNLNHQDFVKERAKRARRIKVLVSRGSKAHRDFRNGDFSARTRLRDVKAELKRMISPTSDFSRFCEVVLRGYREHEWVDQMV